MQYNFNGNNYEVVINKKKIKNIHLRVQDGKIVVSCGYFTSEKDIKKLIDNNIIKINKMIISDNMRSMKSKEFYYFGQVYDVIYGFKNFEIDNNKIYVYDENELMKYIDKEIKKIFMLKLDEFYHKFNRSIPNVSLRIRKMKTRWGVCNVKTKVVTLNSELYKYDICCLEYVIVHELSHLIHPNHSKDFWNLVEENYPKYKECKKLLKE